MMIFSKHIISSPSIFPDPNPKHAIALLNLLSSTKIEVPMTNNLST